ncbi:MAG: ribonuclease HI family protein [Elusimicrobiota bacterium]
MTDKFNLYTDGACWGNPGPASAGVIIKDKNNKKVFEGSIYLGRATNNIAEYNALIEGLKIARRQNIEYLDVFSDSQLVIRQVIGEYKVKSGNLFGLKEKVLKYKKGFKNIEFHHSSRDSVEQAHKLAEKILKNKFKPKTRR